LSTQVIDHWLAQARHVPSSNCNQRPDAVLSPVESINLLVVHNISLPVGQFGGAYIEQLFTNCLDCDADTRFDDLRGLEVSSHLLIDREGEITQFVPFNLRAWHAGESEFMGRKNCNDFSIGIELEGDDNTPYTEAQYQTLVNAVRQLQACYPAISPDRIVGHSDIAPGRKTDPGDAFDWAYFRQLLTS
jgi:AmpD protein